MDNGARRKLSISYYADEIERIASTLPVNPVLMSGMRADLEILRKQIEDTYERVFAMDFGASEAAHFGWQGDELRNMRLVAEEIRRRIVEIYAVIERALG